MIPSLNRNTPLYYHIAISPPPRAGFCSSGDCNTTDNMAMFTNLQYGVNYTAAVSVVSCGGESEFSSPLTWTLTAEGYTYNVV